ncbi:GNAT family N-acetyltransferase [Pantoea rodasii]|uniref:GNAT family N-acetyltransferase n=1 Tax=Pantoea rodasii TaxID=1076549 RepID=A0A2M9W6Q4_9GAMM|nr:GNAT family N-acetyltransferase [Pantoea rodasii]ORM62847.1 GNAT family N-acetyltransferase [Pantoea rodasii]PJZ03220.1 GNAT family N-acetyltransferase [Pantoea rodasii]
MYWESERLLYRPVIRSDLQALFRIYGDARTHQFNPRGPYPNIGHAREVLLRRIKDRAIHGFDDWAIAEKSEPQHVIGFGGVFVSEFNGRRINNLGYRFEPDAWGKGYATELASRALQYGFEELRLGEIVGVVRENHTASRRVLEKVGMTLRERVFNPQDPPASLMFTITRQQWRERDGFDD